MQVVSALGGLSWISSSLNWRFGHIPSFETCGRLVSIFSILSTVYGLVDFMDHLQQFLINKKTESAMDYGFDFQSKRGSHVGFKYESPSCWYCLVTAFFGHQNQTDRAKVQMVTQTPSSVPVIVMSAMIAGVSTIWYLNFYYLIWGHQGMIYLQSTFPRTHQMVVYLALCVALVNNFGAFTGSLVE